MTKKSSAKKEKDRLLDDVDTQFYNVEKIVKSKVEGNKISYEVKWEGYKQSENSEELEWRLCCDEKLLEFLLSSIDQKTYIQQVPGILQNLEKSVAREEFLKKVLDPLSTIAQTTFQCGSVKFISHNIVESKIKLLKYVKDFKQEYLLNSAMIPTVEVIDESVDRYQRELEVLRRDFPEHPVVRVKIPKKLETVFYSPPPLSNLLFEPVTLKMFQNKKNIDHLFVSPNLTDTGFNRTLPFVLPADLNMPVIDEDPRFLHHYPEHNGKKRFDGMDRLNYREDRRFIANLTLQQQKGSGWVLKVASDVPKETPLLMMTGVICPDHDAQKSLELYGERVALSSFVRIPGFSECLDRRELFDFSKYIPHSCVPTCSVRLVESGNKYPDLVVYSLIPLNENVKHSITLDWYKGFTKDVTAYFRAHRIKKNDKLFHLMEQEIDCVQCRCLEEKCRDVLYITAPKNEEESSNESSTFKGMSIAEENKIWSIKTGKFT